jgi:hypothetical protein
MSSAGSSTARAAAGPRTERSSEQFPDEADRPPFGRLAGITSFPDVPILDEDHEIVHDMRVRDPPARPQFDEANPDGLVERLHQAGEVMAWDALV